MIIAVARKIFAEKGYEQTTIQELCRACNIAQGTIYVYFRNKREVFRAVLFDTVDRVQEIMMTPFDQDQIQLDPEGKIDLQHLFKLRISRILNALMADADTFRIFLSELQSMNREFQSLLNRVNRIMLTHIEQALTLGMKLNLFRQFNPRQAAQMIAGTVLMFINTGLREKEKPPTELLAEQISDLLLFGLISQGRNN